MSLSTLNGGVCGDNSRIMVKVRNESNGNTLHIVYRNNHFEPIDTCYQIIVSFNCQNQNKCETKNDGMTKIPTNKKNELHNKRKIFT
jgi:hypothetical protein